MIKTKIHSKAVQFNIEKNYALNKLISMPFKELTGHLGSEPNLIFIEKAWNQFKNCDTEKNGVITFENAEELINKISNKKAKLI